MLHFNPEKVAKFSKMVFNVFRLSKLNIVATLVSSAKPSALSVSHFDSVSKQGLFSDLIASRIAGCGMLSLLQTVLGTCRWLKTLAISGQSSILVKVFVVFAWRGTITLGSAPFQVEGGGDGTVIIANAGVPT
jgi:hypothetical protein